MNTPSIPVSLRNNYVNAKSNNVFVYRVLGTPAQIEAYKKAQADFFRQEEDGTALWFSTNFIGKKGHIIITTKGKVVADMSAFRQAESLTKQFGGNFGQEIAKASVAQLLGDTPAPTAEPEQPAQD